MGLQTVERAAGQFKAALGSLAATVNVITMWDAQRHPLGMTATAVASVSVDPLLILVCVHRSSRTYEHITRTGRFGVNVLGSAAREISDHCSRPGQDKYLRHRWLADNRAWRTPALSGAVAFLDCAVDQDVRAGTHAVLVGAVHGIGLSSAAHHEPLLHFRGTYRQLRSENHYPRARPLPVALEELT